MNQWKMLDHFSKICKKYIEDLDPTDIEYLLLPYGIDRSGPCCSDGELYHIFKEATKNSIDDSELCELIEKICLEYCNTL